MVYNIYICTKSKRVIELRKVKLITTSVHKALKHLMSRKYFSDPKKYFKKNDNLFLKTSIWNNIQNIHIYHRVCYREKLIKDKMK
jgi:hypothetical protein